MSEPRLTTGSAVRPQRVWLMLAIWCVGVIAVFWPTVYSMVAIWMRSDTFAHGFLIAPISLWLLWERRAELRHLLYTPSAGPLLLLIPLGLLWLIANIVDVLVAQQLAFVAILITGVWALVGKTAIKPLAFPLGFLFLAVPMGEGLIPAMMEFTATATVKMVELTGIPVYREGLFFSLPSGDWSVVEACSGVRYLIASFTLGILFAYLTYRSLGRRLLFILASIIVPILANALRAYIIVMLGHLSDMTIATGADHLVYGWVFFGVVVILLFWVGSFWREDMTGASASGDEPTSVAAATDSKLSPRRPLVVLLAALAVAALWPLLASTLADRPALVAANTLAAPSIAGPWQPLSMSAPWLPVADNTDNSLQSYYQSFEQPLVGLSVNQFSSRRDDVELVRSPSWLYANQGDWYVQSEQALTIALPGRELRLIQLELRRGQQRLSAWSWYRIGSRNTANPYVAKGLELLASLSIAGQSSARIVVATPDVGDDAKSALDSFVRANIDAIENVIDGVAWEVEP